eukprot:6176838-Pleurochrysis_carterae.AAC.4
MSHGLQTTSFECQKRGVSTELMVSRATKKTQVSNLALASLTSPSLCGVDATAARDEVLDDVQ